MYPASYCNVYINQRDAQILVNSLYFFVKWLYMFRTIINPTSGATFNKLYSATGTYRHECYIILHHCKWDPTHTIHSNITLAHVFYFIS